MITFDGFLRVYKESYDDDNEQEDEGRLLPPLSKGEKLIRKEILATQTLYPMSAPLYGSQPGTQTGRVGHRSSIYIRTYHFYCATTRLCRKRNSEGVKRPYDTLKLKGGEDYGNYQDRDYGK